MSGLATLGVVIVVVAEQFVEERCRVVEEQSPQLHRVDFVEGPGRRRRVVAQLVDRRARLRHEQRRVGRQEELGSARARAVHDGEQRELTGDPRPARIPISDR